MDTALVPDVEILDILKSKPNVALRSLYTAYYRYICSVVYKMLGDGSMAEDISQEVFVEVWKRRESLDVNTSLKGYLRKIAVNKTLNHIRAKRMDFEQEDAIFQVPSTDNSTQRILEAEDLQKAINVAVDGLPERCRIIFGLSRYEEKTYREISVELGISIKTVENQISKALKLVRKAVLDYQDEKKSENI